MSEQTGERRGGPARRPRARRIFFGRGGTLPQPARDGAGQTLLSRDKIKEINVLICEGRTAPFILRELGLAEKGMRLDTLRKHAQRFRRRRGLPPAARGRNPTLGGEKRLAAAVVELVRAMKGVRAARLPRVLGAAVQRTFEERAYPGVHRALENYRNPFATKENRLAAAIVELLRAAAGVRDQRLPFALGLALRDLEGDRLLRDVADVLDRFLIRGRAVARDAGQGGRE